MVTVHRILIFISYNSVDVVKYLFYNKKMTKGIE